MRRAHKRNFYDELKCGDKKQISESSVYYTGTDRTVNIMPRQMSGHYISNSSARKSES